MCISPQVCQLCPALSFIDFLLITCNKVQMCKQKPDSTSRITSTMMTVRSRQIWRNSINVADYGIRTNIKDKIAESDITKIDISKTNNITRYCNRAQYTLSHFNVFTFWEIKNLTCSPWFLPCGLWQGPRSPKTRQCSLLLCLKLKGATKKFKHIR